MSDDRIIDFNELKNKVKETDVDKFENYMYDLYFSVMDGNLTMAQFTNKIYDYMRDNNISNEKFMKMQKKLLERYGIDDSEIERQLKNMGIDSSNLDKLGSVKMSDIKNGNVNLNDFSKNEPKPKIEVVPKNSVDEGIIKDSDFYRKFSSKLEFNSFVISHLKNDVNDIEIIIDKENITLVSNTNINLVDSQLNEFLLDYKNMLGKKLKVAICENRKEYDY